LKNGATWIQADSEVAAVGQTLLANQRLRPGTVRRYGLMGLQQTITDSFRTPLLLIFASTILVLIIGCVNIAGMLMAKGASRESEIATRMALGASRWDVVRQLLSESLALAAAGGVAGIVAGYFALIALRNVIPEGYLGTAQATLDARVFAGAGLIALLTSLIFGIAPALQAGRVDIRTAQGGRGIAGTRGLLFRRCCRYFKLPSRSPCSSGQVCSSDHSITSGNWIPDSMRRTFRRQVSPCAIRATQPASR
jgi:hypothetical protein